VTPSLKPSSPPPSPQNAAGSDFALSPELLLRSVQKHWLLVLVLLALCIAGSVVYTSTRTPIYETQATVQLDPQPILPLGHEVSPGGVDRGADGYWSNLEYFATQHQIILSRKVSSLVVSKLALNRDAGFLANKRDTQGLPRADVPVEAAAQVLQSRLSVKSVQESRLALVSLKDADPERAQRVLSVLLDIYVGQNLDGTLDSANRTAEWLDAQLGKLKTELESQEMELHDFKRKNNLLSVSFDDQSNMLRAQIQQLNTALTELKARKEHVAARLSVIQQFNPDDPASIPVSDLFGSSTLMPLRERYVVAKKELLRLAALGKGENHPDVQAAGVEFEAARTSLLTELKNIREGVSSDLAAVQRELMGVSGLYETAKEQALGLNLNELRYSRLRRSKDSTERVFGMVLERSSESGLSKMMPFNNVRVLDRPMRPVAPVTPQPLTNLAFGAALGLVLGLVGALSRELSDRSVRNVEEVEQELGLASLGSLPDTSQKRGTGVVYSAYYYGRSRHKKLEAEQQPNGAAPPTELLLHTHPRSAAAEAARAMCTNILFMSPDRPIRSVLVTSAGPAEGKTTVAVSLAVALAQTGRRVCLVDCDLRRPRIHRLFGLTGERGVTTALLDPSELDETLHVTEIPNLSALPAGPAPPNPADLIHSEAFGRLIGSLKDRFDTVVIDSPPACLVTDAVVASTRVEACVLVVRARLTRRDAARRAVRALRSVGANIAGFVMNATSIGQGSYSYRYYGSEESPAEKS
jgi:succinoglycan biosynthesis transport protein ExoP